MRWRSCPPRGGPGPLELFLSASNHLYGRFVFRRVTYQGDPILVAQKPAQEPFNFGSPFEWEPSFIVPALDADMANPQILQNDGPLVTATPPLSKGM